jgi:transcriptional regulator of nitric oxide reductase
MNVIYNSDNYYVVEYAAQGGYELVDKLSARGTFLHGDAADKFAQSMKDAVAEDASAEHLDEFLDSFNELLNLPVVYH